MIYTVTLNPAIDYVVSIEKTIKGGLNYYHFEEYGAGGKGINVSRLLTSFGLENTALGFVRGFSGQEIAASLDREGCHTDFIYLTEGHSRINIKICEDDGYETDFNGMGFPLPSNTASQIIEKLTQAKEGDLLVLAGSLPEGADESIYAQILQWAQKRNILCVVDAVFEALKRTLAFAPFLIKPNHSELGELFGVEIKDVDAAQYYAEKLQKCGARNVVISMGAKGALFMPETGEPMFYKAVSGPTVSTVGAGDSMIAGILYGLQRSGSWEEAMHWGISAGAATAFRTGMAAAEEVEAIYIREF